MEDLDDLKDLIGDERKKADFSFQKVFSLLVLNWQYWMKIILFALSVVMILLVILTYVFL